MEPSSWSWRRDWPCHAPGASALLFVGVFPANVPMAYDGRDRPAPAPALAYGRLPLHLWARAAGRSATG